MRLHSNYTMIEPIDFFVGITDGQTSIEAIHVKLEHKMPFRHFYDMMTFLNTDTAQFVSDINASKLGSDAFNRVLRKVQHLSTILTTAEVLIDANFENYGVDVDYEDVGIPVPYENPVLFVNFFGNIHKKIYSDDFNTVLYDLLVCASG